MAKCHRGHLGPLPTGLNPDLLPGLGGFHYSHFEGSGVGNSDLARPKCPGIVVQIYYIQWILEDSLIRGREFTGPKMVQNRPFLVREISRADLALGGAKSENFRF